MIPLYQTPHARRLSRWYTALLFVAGAFALVVGKWPLRFEAVLVMAFVVPLALDAWRPPRPLLVVGDGGVAWPGGPTLLWSEVAGIVVDGPDYLVAPRDPNALRHFAAWWRLVRSADSALTGWAVCAVLPVRQISEADLAVLDGLLTRHAVRRLEPKGGPARRLARRVLRLLAP